MSKKVSLILACTVNGGIAYENDIPWYIPEDLKKFKRITTKCNDPNKINAVIMGRNTWQSLKKPLSGRLNIIITSNTYYKPFIPKQYDDGSIIVLHNIMAALAYCEKSFIENIFVIGGAQLYDMFLERQTYRNMIHRIYLSVLFYDDRIKTDKHIAINKLFEHFKLAKDPEYKKCADEKVFESYICTARTDS